MASGAVFDYYRELGVHETASAHEIRTAYFRLALVRHPDRNPQDPNATASFQRVVLTCGLLEQLQEAYETLSNPSTKASYDAARDRSRQQAAANEAARQGDRPFTGFWSTQMNDAMAQLHRRAQMERARIRAERQRAVAVMAAARQRREAEMLAERQRVEAQQRAEFKRLVQERRERRDVEAGSAEFTLRKVQEDNRRRAERREEAAREAAVLAEQQQQAERMEQESRWTIHKAVTREDKQKACLHSHSENWPKEVHQRETRCEHCGQKRSTTTFSCPYCELVVCQMCREVLAREEEASEE
ncbi:DnaJ-domain-containing protein [Apiospora saccharicola]|uniref:DnaJ-domain-containing protein n=1 Tax=Apiospora saccharicola TaxID=335842 RepID=A0ABR1W0N0_9PEZI